MSSPRQKSKTPAATGAMLENQVQGVCLSSVPFIASVVKPGGGA